MRYSTRLNNLAELEEPHGGAAARSNTPSVLLRRGSAGNDAACEYPAISEDEIERRAQHARAANGLGDFATADAAFSPWMMSERLLQAARAHRAAALAEITVAAIRSVAAIARRAHARHQQRRQAKAAYDMLRQLDDRTLHDLGFDRSEISSVAAEVTGIAERTRVHALASSHNHPSARLA